MSTTWAKPLNLNKNQLQNAAIQPLASAPSSPADGQVYKDTTQHAVYFWDANAAVWAPADASKATNIPTSAIIGLGGFVTAYRLDQLAVPTNPVAMNGQRLTGLATPTSASDAATMAFVTGQVQAAALGISGKGSVVVLATTNQALSYGSYPTIDGITLFLNARVLLTGQTTASQNGAYVAGAAGFTRVTTDANNELETGAFWLVESGTANGGSQWWLTSPVAGTTITPGTTSITITKFGVTVAYTAGTNGGLNLASGAFSVAAGNGIVVDSTGVHVDASKVVQKFSQTHGDGSTLAYTITHNLNNAGPMVLVLDASGNEVVPDSVRTSLNVATITYTVAPTTNQYTAYIQG
jgi:hypothetical protein